MKSSTTDRVAGRAKEAKGKVKKAAGRIARRPDIEEEGAIEELAGKGRRKVGEVKKVFER